MINFLSWLALLSTVGYAFLAFVTFDPFWVITAEPFARFWFAVVVVALAAGLSGES